MATAGLIVAVIAILIALASYRLSRRADRRQEREATRSVRRDAREEAEAAARRQGRPIVTPRGGSGGPAADPVVHHYEVRNGGYATIIELQLWIVDGEARVVSPVAGGAVAIGPGDPPVLMGVEVHQPLPDEQTLMVRWRDADGEHEEATGIPPRRHW